MPSADSKSSIVFVIVVLLRETCKVAPTLELGTDFISGNEKVLVD